MARAATRDHLQVFAFSLHDAGDFLTGGDMFEFGGGAAGGVGFASVGALVVTAEPEPINEGTWPFSHYVVLRAQTGKIRLQRGMMPKDSDFYNWFHTCLFGYIYTRRNLYLTMNRRNGVAAKTWLMHQCLPTSVTVWPELNATSSDVAIAELELQPEWVEEIPISTA